jgi:hypothetical protein
MSDEDPETPEEEMDEEESVYSRGDLVVSLDCPDARISVAVPEGSDPALIGRLLDMAVTAIGKLKTQMQ